MFGDPNQTFIMSEFPFKNEKEFTTFLDANSIENIAFKPKSKRYSDEINKMLNYLSSNFYCKT